MQSPKMNPCIISKTNLALFHTGVMLDRLFYCPQMYGSNGLFMDFQWCSYWPEDASDVYWDLGLMNESLHWAHEAMEQKGTTPTLLERCGLIYLVKGNYEAAKPFFLNLKKVPFQKNLADHLLALSNDSLQAAQDSVIHLERSKMISDESVVSIRITIPEKLEMLLEKNPHNKMAFDYLAAYCLMNNDLQRLLPHLLGGRNFAYKKIPLHIQEALLMAAANYPAFDKTLLNEIVQPATAQRFAEFQQVFQKYQYQSGKCKVGNTNAFWRYLLALSFI